jgi:hypothetical protein
MRPRFPLITFLGKKRTTTVRLKHNVNHFFLLIRFFLSFSLTSCCGQRAKEGPLTKKSFSLWLESVHCIDLPRKKQQQKVQSSSLLLLLHRQKYWNLEILYFLRYVLILAVTNICHYYELICQGNKSER